MALHCHRCCVWIPDNEDHCLQCGACANCSLLETESSQPSLAIAFCPTCGAGLPLRRPRQGIALWIWLLLRGAALAALMPIAMFSAMGTLCIVLDIRRADDLVGALVFGIIGSLSSWAIIALARQRP